MQLRTLSPPRGLAPLESSRDGTGRGEAISELDNSDLGTKRFAQCETHCSLPVREHSCGQ